jgi:hypothetical protein
MVALPNISSQDGPRISINDWLKDPLRIPVYVIDMMKQGFLADAVLRTAGQAPAGVVRFEESTPIYADSVVLDRQEFAEVPVARTSLGQPNVAYTVDKSLAVVISDEDKRRSSIDKLAIRMTQVKNSLIRSWDDVFVAAVLTNANILTSAASANWATGTTDIRNDILAGMKAIESAVDAQGSELGFEADTLIVSRTDKYNIIRSPQFNLEYYGGDIASENLRYTGKLPQKIMDLDVLYSPRVPVGKAIMLQRGVSGFIADELALNATALYRDEPRKTWRSDIQRVSAVGIDQPKSVCVITATTGP